MADESTIRQQLVDGAIETIRHQGITGASAHSIAHTAGVDEALIHQHFASLPELLADGCSGRQVGVVVAVAALADPNRQLKPHSSTLVRVTSGVTPTVTICQIVVSDRRLGPPPYGPMTRKVRIRRRYSAQDTGDHRKVPARTDSITSEVVWL